MVSFSAFHVGSSLSYIELAVCSDYTRLNPPAEQCIGYLHLLSIYSIYIIYASSGTGIVKLHTLATYVLEYKIYTVDEHLACFSDGCLQLRVLAYTRMS